MNKDKMDNGVTPDVRYVPLYIIKLSGEGKGDTGEIVSQLRIAPTICYLLGISATETMKQPPIVLRDDGSKCDVNEGGKLCINKP